MDVSKTIFTIKCTDCESIIAGGFAPLTQPEHILCNNCLRLYGDVMDYYLGGREYRNYIHACITKINWDLLGGGAKRKGNRNAHDIALGWRKLK